MNTELFTLIGTILSITLSSGVLMYLFVPKTRQKDQDDLIRTELWNKVQNLSAKYDELFNKYAELYAEYSVLKNENNLSVKFDELIQTIKTHP
jgi:hypothetical protein